MSLRRGCDIWNGAEIHGLFDTNRPSAPHLMGASSDRRMIAQLCRKLGIPSAGKDAAKCEPIPVAAVEFLLRRPGIHRIFDTQKLP